MIESAHRCRIHGLGVVYLLWGLVLLPAGAIADIADLPRGSNSTAAEHFHADKLEQMKTYAVAVDVTVVIQPEGAADHPGSLVLADDEVDRTCWLSSDSVAERRVGGQNSGTTGWEHPWAALSNHRPAGAEPAFRADRIARYGAGHLRRLVDGHQRLMNGAQEEKT